MVFFLQDHLGWKRPLRLLNSAIKPRLQRQLLHHVSAPHQSGFQIPSCIVTPPLPQQPVPGFDDSFGDGIVLTVQRKPPLAKPILTLAT